MPDDERLAATAPARFGGKDHARRALTVRAVVIACLLLPTGIALGINAYSFWT